ncbi:glycosyl transferase family 1 [Ruegeria sp. ANG-S4]|uniref:glycosyltransferase family 4 protein n=1 Tax=Ruegeria sp. ANG-S4 TaxID=1577904 RepID=UPI00057E5A2C|nr:glycosyltransferase family 4 protein [Ruegeria sp. ANG-S4]KIC45534.1 glycosyl transferase family 1 [Ruegeria sp. ANG-S4]
MKGPIAYLTGEYPKVSHTFIQREVMALRAKGAEVLTCTVRRPPPKEISGPEQVVENDNTFCILQAAQSPLRILRTHTKLFTRSPSRWVSALLLAIKTTSPGPKALLYQLFYFVEAGILADHLLTKHVKHLHNHFGNSSCTVAMLTSELSGIPYSFTMHGPAIFFEAERWRIDEKVARARFVSCISYFCRSQVMLFSDQQHWSKLRIVHCGVVVGDYGSSDEKRYGKNVLFIGRLSAVKGAPLLLETFAKVLRDHPAAQLTIVGDGDDRAALEEHARVLGLKEAVRFLGYCNQTEVADLLRQSDILVLPSFAEGVPVVLMEAMASRIPVIASQVAGVPELVNDGVHGFITPPGDLNTLAQRLNELLSNPKRCEQMGLSARKKIEAEYNIDLEAGRLLQLFSSDDQTEFSIHNARSI